MRGLSFEFDWVDAEGISGPELSATWASLRIQAGSSVLTRVLDSRAKTVRDFVYVPLYPLAEWLASNWWFLTHEFENPAKEGDPDFHRRHALGTSREGYAFPNLEIVPSGARTRLVWDHCPSPWTKVEFLNRGETWVDSSELRETCADLVDQVIRRLVSLGADETFLQEEWNAIQATDAEESKFCRATAGLGWDPYALDDEQRDGVLLLAEKLGALLDEAVPALDTENLYAGWSAIESAVERAKLNSVSLRLLAPLGDEFARNERIGGNPWEVGYGLARRLRGSLDLDGDPLPTMTRMAEALGEDPESIEKVTRLASPFTATPLIDGVITRNDDQLPAFAFRRVGEHGRRFHFCRALVEVLASPGEDALLTRAHSERQQRNRAFAAEFLAPSSGLRKRISREVVDGEDIDELAVEFGVSSRVVEHQIVNHRIARIRQQERSKQMEVGRQSDQSRRMERSFGRPDRGIEP